MSRRQRQTDEQRISEYLMLSNRHRTWCDNVPACDIDSTDHLMAPGVLVEYDNAIPRALIDYKRGSFLQDTNTSVMVWLADRADLPAFAVVYHPGDDWWFWVTALNERAHRWMTVWPGGRNMTEAVYVRWLHTIRGRSCCQTWTPAEGVTSAR